MQACGTSSMYVSTRISLYFPSITTCILRLGYLISLRDAHSSIWLRPRQVPVSGIADVNIVDQQLLAQAGYHRERGQWRMEIEMYEAPPLAVWPEGVSVRPCIPEQDTHAIFETQLDAFAEHRGYTQPSFETWEHFHVKQEGFDPSLWFLACEGKTVAGICLCNYWVSDGFVGTRGVGHSWRRKGLGLALLQHSFDEFYRRGTRTVKLMVDTLNPTGATRLYERAGMHVTQLRYLYEKELRPGKEPGDLTTTE